VHYFLTAGFFFILYAVTAGYARDKSEWVSPPCLGMEDVEYGVLRSPATGGEVSYHILLPPAYEHDRRRRFPVIYWLHGTNGLSRGCGGIKFMANFYTQLMQDGLMPQSVVVFPNGLDHGMWCDSADGRQKPESMLVEDLIPHIDQSYRTIPSREGRAIEGFSMGGYGAGRIGFKHNSLFGAITMYGAGPLHMDFLKEDPKLQPVRARAKIFRGVYGADADYYIANQPESLALKVLEASHLRSPPDLRIVVGGDDWLKEDNKLLSIKLKESFGLDHDYLEFAGIGHKASELVRAAKDSTIRFYQSVFGEL
jgi:enterochelin esterase-like enzyme